MIWGILGGVLLSLLASELYDSCPRLTNLLLRSASRRLPAEYRDRYWGEWMGELDSQGDLGKLRKLLWALWVFLCSWQMGRTLQSAVEQAKRSGLPEQQQEDERVFSLLKGMDELKKLESEYHKMLQNEDAKFPGSVKSSPVLWPPSSGLSKKPSGLTEGIPPRER